MKRFLRILTLLFVIGVIASLFIPTVKVHAKVIPPGTELRDPHFHTGDFVTCCNQIQKACNSE